MRRCSITMISLVLMLMGAGSYYTFAAVDQPPSYAESVAPSAPPADAAALPPSYEESMAPSAPAEDLDPETAAVEAEASQDLEASKKQNGGAVPFDKLMAIWKKTSTTISKKTDGGAKVLDIALITLPLVNSLLKNKAGIKNVVLKRGLSGFKGSFSIIGTVTIEGVPLVITLLCAPFTRDEKQGGTSLTFTFPPNTSLDKMIPGVNIKALGAVPIAYLNCVVSNFNYTDPKTYCEVVEGLNIFAGLNPSQIKIFQDPSVKKVIDVEGGSVIGVATITKSAGEEAEAKKTSLKTSFKVIIPPHAIKIKQFKLSELTSLLKMPMPAKVKAALSGVTLDNLGVTLDFTTGYESFMLEGVVGLFGATNVHVHYKIFNGDAPSSENKEGVVATHKTVLVNMLSLSIPDSWSIAKAIPELKILAPLSAREQQFLIIMQSYVDPVDGMTIPAGVSYSGVIDIGALGNNQLLKGLGQAVGQQVVVHGLLLNNLADSQFEVTLGKDRAKEAKVSLGDLVPSNFGVIKRDLSKASFSLGEFRLKFGGANATQMISATGTAALGTMVIPTELRAVYENGEWKTDIVISAPEKVSGIEVLNALGNIPFTSFKVAIIQEPYIDPVTGVSYAEGLNIGGYLAFTGAMSFVDKLFKIKGLNVNSVIGMQSLDSPNPSMKLEANLPGNSSINLGNGIKMEQLKVYMVVGMAPSLGLEGTVLVPVPKEYRPKKGTPSKPMTTAALDVPEQQLVHDQEPELATSMDVTVPAHNAAADGDIVITGDDANAESGVIDNAILAEIAAEEIPSPVDESVELVFEDTDINMSDFAPPVGDSNTLALVGALAVSGESGIISCAMNGAVDVRGIVLENVGFEAQIAMAVPPIPTGLGFRADLQIGHGKNPKVINFAAKMAVGTTTTSYAWIGAYKGGLYFSEIVGLAFDVTKRAPGATQQFRKEFFNAMKKVPKIGVDDLSMAIVPLPTTIAGKAYPMGTSVDARFVLFGAHGRFAAEISDTGISGTGWLDKITLPRKNPQFTLSSFDGSAGASVNFSVGKGKQVATIGNEFMVDGKLEIKPLGFNAAATIKVTMTEGNFTVISQIYGLYSAEIQGKLDLEHIKNAQIKAILKQEALSKLSGLLRDAAKQVIAESGKELDKASANIKNEFDPKIAKARETVQKERASATGAVSGANNSAQSGIDKELAKARKQIQDSKNAIKSRNDRIKKHKGNLVYAANEKAKNIKDQLIITEQEAYIKILLKPGKTVVKGTLDVAKGAVNLTPIDSDPRVSSLIVAKETALAGIKAGKFGAQSVAELSKGLSTAAEKTLNIKSLEIDVNLGDLMKGALPKVSLTGTILTKKINIKELQIDIRKPASLLKLATLIIHSLK